MKWYKTKFVNKIGDEEYPIYLIDRDGKYDLECEFEIYALAWFDIYEQSIKALERGELNEIINKG